MKKCIILLVVLSILFSFFLVPSYAGSFLQRLGNGTVEDPGLNNLASSVNSDITSNAGKLYQALRAIAIVVAVIATAIVGITYITSGTAAKRAELKSRLIFIVVGLALALCATMLVEKIGKFWGSLI